MQQDGAGFAQGLRPNGGAAVGYFDGLLRQRWRLLSLLVFRRPRLRSDRAGGRLCSRVPADGGGAALRCFVAAEEDQALAPLRSLICDGRNAAKPSRAPVGGAVRRDVRG